MKARASVAAVLLTLGLFGSGPALSADDSKAKEGVKQIESGAKQTGEGVADTAKGIGKTVVGGAETAGDKIKEASEAAKPKAKNAWENVRDGAVSFGQSVKTFFTRLFSDRDNDTKAGPGS